MKSIVDLLNQYDLTSNVASNQLFKSDFENTKSMVGLWFTKLIQSNLLPTPTYPAQYTKPNLPSQMFKIQEIKYTEPNILSQIHSIKPRKLNIA